jgi:hypothetical protein
LLQPEIFKIGDDEPQIQFVIGKDSTQRLNCSSVGEPQPIYEWFKDGDASFISINYFNALKL